MAGESTQLTVQIGSEESGEQDDRARTRRLVLERAGNGPEPNQIFVDQFPDDSQISVSVTSGSISRHFTSSKQVVEVLTFNNADSVNLKFSGATSVKITQLGALLDAGDGNNLSTSFKHDRDKASITIRKKAYGSIKVEYSVPFVRHVYTFEGECPAVAPEPDSNGVTPDIFTPATILALWRIAGGASAATVLQVTNPNDRCKFVPKDDEPKFVVDIVGQQADPSTAFSNFRFVSVLRIFPSTVSPTLKVTRGQPPKKCKTSTIKVDDEFLVYNQSFSASLELPVKDGINVVADGEFVDQFGKSFPVSENMIAKPGTVVEEVTWSDSKTFESNNSFRRVRRGELVLTDGSDHTLPATGVVKVAYEADFTAYIYEHVLEKDSETKEIVARETVLTLRQGNIVRAFLIPLQSLMNPRPVQDICGIGVGGQ